MAALGLRLWAIEHGLPFVYNADEELHFVPVAVDMFRNGSLNPGYFENPPALTYLLYAIFKLRFSAGFPFGSSSGFVREFLDDPEAVYVTARVVVALIGTLVVALACWAGARFYERRVGLVAAALLAFAFLPVFYSKFALNDVVTLAPICVALVGCLLVWERARPLDWVLAGAAVGAATATKYTAGAMLLPLGLAALYSLRTPGRAVSRTLAGAVLAGLAFGLAFLVLNPFSLLDFSEFRSQVGGQSATAGGSAKLGQDDVPGWIYYVGTLGWGLGWLPLLALVAGAVLALRDDLRRGLLLLAFPLALFLFLGAQERYFGRWFLPAYPALAILCGYAAVRAADALGRLRAARGGPRSAALALAAIAALLVIQGLVSSMRVNAVLEREDTRTLARTWLAENVAPGSGVVVEPFIPQQFLQRGGRMAPDRYRRYPVKRPFQAYERKLRPELVDRYRREGYCWVVTGSHQRERGLKEGIPSARAYYARLDREAPLRARFSPYRANAERIPEFSFDLSFNYLPRAYLRPGPVVDIRRLDGCRDRRA